jgi:hypothetical protein
MTKKVSARLSYALMLSIFLVIIGFIGLGVRAFASAVISDSIYLAAFGALLATLTIYFVLHRPVAGAAISGGIHRLPSAWLGQLPRHIAWERKDRRTPLVSGHELAAVGPERRSNQLAGFRVANIERVASGTLRG